MTIPVTEAESVILAALWRHGPLSVAPGLFGADRSERDDGRQRYHAAIERRDYLAGEVDTLVARLFDGRRDALKAFLDEG